MVIEKRTEEDNFSISEPFFLKNPERRTKLSKFIPL